jgi:tetratricopeptide (TPR) repeat protein
MPVEDVISQLIEEGRQLHREGRHEHALRKYQKAIEHAHAHHDPRFVALLHLAAAEHRDCDRYHHAVELLLVALQFFTYDGNSNDEVPEGLLRARAEIKKLLAIIIEDVYGPRRPQVLQLLEESRREFAALNEPLAEANILDHIGGCYTTLGNLEAAELSLTAAYDKARAGSATQLESWILNSFARLAIKRADYGAAFDYADQALSRAQSIADAESEADALVVRSSVFQRTMQLPEARQSAERALALYIDIQDRRRSIRARRQLARVLALQGEQPRARTVLEEALHIASLLFLYGDQCAIHLQLGELELSEGNIIAVYSHISAARNVADTNDLFDLVDRADQLSRRVKLQERRQ